MAAPVEHLDVVTSGQQGSNELPVEAPLKSGVGPHRLAETGGIEDAIVAAKPTTSLFHHPMEQIVRHRFRIVRQKDFRRRRELARSMAL